MKISKRNKTQETAEVETEIDPTVETIQEIIIETTTGMVVEITTTETEVEIAETTAEIEAEEETDLIPEKEEENNLDLDQVKDTFTGMTSAISAIRTGHSTLNCFNSRERRRNQPRSGSGQRYFDRHDFCNFCNRTGHSTHNCF